MVLSTSESTVYAFFPGFLSLFFFLHSLGPFYFFRLPFVLYTFLFSFLLPFRSFSVPFSFFFHDEPDERADGTRAFGHGSLSFPRFKRAARRKDERTSLLTYTRSCTEEEARITKTRSPRKRVCARVCVQSDGGRLRHLIRSRSAWYIYLVSQLSVRLGLALAKTL